MIRSRVSSEDSLFLKFFFLLVFKVEGMGVYRLRKQRIRLVVNRFMERKM